MELSNSPDNKSDSVKDWLKNLSRESWQLELLVSAFTIFLLIAGQERFSDFYLRISFEIDLKSEVFSIIYLFLGLVGICINVLIISLILHLLLRGFWIGTIGLRSVQDHVEWRELKYSDFFTQKLKEKVRNIDQLVIFLDEICSVIFSLSYLLISIFLAFGLTFGFGVFIVTLFQGIVNELDKPWSVIIQYMSNVFNFAYFIFGLIYLIDFLTLGFFKKNKLISRLYYPIYLFFGYISLSFISRSIYYHLINRFTKRKIRISYLLFVLLLIVTSFIDFDHSFYFSSGNPEYYSNNNYYDEFRSSDKDYVVKAAVPSRQITDKYCPLFIRYNPNDNSILKAVCQDFKIKSSESLNWSISLNNDKAIDISQIEKVDSLTEKKLTCLSSIYRIGLNDSILNNDSFVFQLHPITNQKGISMMIPSELFKTGLNHLRIEKIEIVEDRKVFRPFSHLRVWK